MDTWINIGMYVAYALVGICILGILIFSLARIFTHPAAAKSALIGIVGLGVIALLSYLVSSGADASTVFAKLEVDESTSKWVGAGLISFYILIGLAILSILFVEVSRLFNK